MTDVDQLPAVTPTPPEGPADRPRRRRPSRWWWVALAVLLGAAIGTALGRWDMNVASTKAITSTSQGTDEQVPAGLIGNGSTSTPPATHTIDNRVFVVGDSVMQGAAPYLSTDLPTWSVIADTKVGRFLDEANTVISKRQKDIGKIVVLNLGNNYNGDKAEFTQQVATTMAELAGVEHVIWINVAEYQDNRADVNDVLTQAAQTHSNLTVVDWNSWWEANRSFTGSDHLHLTDDGAKAYASLVSAAVQRVTSAAGEIPAPGVQKPSLNTSGTIPGSRSRTTVGTSYRTHTTVRHAATTQPPSSGASDQSVATSPPATSPPTVDTAPRTSTVSIPATSPSPPHTTP